VVREVDAVAVQPRVVNARLAVEEPAVDGILDEAPREEADADEREGHRRRGVAAPHDRGVERGEEDDVEGEGLVQREFVDEKATVFPCGSGFSHVRSPARRRFRLTPYAVWVPRVSPAGFGLCPLKRKPHAD
jgi:hypothetical protein